MRQILEKLSAEKACLFFYSLFLLSIPFLGLDWRFRMTALNDPWKWAHLFLAASILCAVAVIFKRRSIRLSRFHLLAALYFVVVLGGWFTTPDRSAFPNFVLGVVRGLAALFPLTAISPNVGQRRVLLTSLVATALLGSTLAFLQEIDRIMPLNFLPEFPDGPFFLLFGLPLTRASGYMLDPNYFAILPAIALIVWSMDIGLKERPWIQWAVGVALAFGFIVTFPRSALAAAIVVCLAVWIRALRSDIRRRRLSPVTASGGAAIILAAIVLVWLVIYRGYRDPSLPMRLMNLQDAWAVFLSQPLIGRGLGSVIALSRQHQVSHNFYLEILASTGLIGLATWIGLFSQLARQIFQRLALRAKTFEPYAILFILAFGLAFNLTTNLLFWTLLGLVEFSLVTKKTDSQPHG